MCILVVPGREAREQQKRAPGSGVAFKNVDSFVKKNKFFLEVFFPRNKVFQKKKITGNAVYNVRWTHTIIFWVNILQKTSQATTGRPI